MNYTEYNTEYHKVILKESLKRGIPIKQRLVDIINTTDRQDILKLYLQNNDFDGQIAFNDRILEDLGNDEEFRELIEKDTEVILLLRETAENRLKQLEEQDKNKRPEEAEQENDEEQDGHLEESHNSKRGRMIIGNNLEFDEETQHIYCEPMSMIQRDGQVLAMIKRSAISAINGMRDTKMNVDRCPSPEMLVFMANSRDLYDKKTKQMAKNYMDMPECDEELRMLCEQMVIAGEQVNETVDRHIAKYQESLKTKPRDEEKNLEGELQQQGDGERETENIGEPKKSWELSPGEKARIQRSLKQVAKKHIESQSNPQQTQTEPIIEGTTEIDR